MSTPPLGRDYRTIILESPKGYDPAPGTELVIHNGLDRDLNALRPVTFLFADPDDWIIRDFRIGTRSQFKASQFKLRNDVLARDFLFALVDCGCNTIQTRQLYAMRAIPQRTKLRFRCEIAGPWA